mgnify:CR=1 FL=1|tara:strand:- start:168 stop:467 length:300 start_codon:yes stop_codon:yes gene_type:complete
MKVGDLVTLSAYGLKMGPMWNWKREVREGKRPVGIIVAIKENPHTYSWTSENEKLRFYIEWCGEGPVSRDNGSSRRSHIPGARKKDYYYFYRKDLRFVK